MRFLGDRTDTPEMQERWRRAVVRKFQRIAWRQRQREDIELGWLDLGEAGA